MRRGCLRLEVPEVVNVIEVVDVMEVAWVLETFGAVDVIEVA